MITTPKRAEMRERDVSLAKMEEKTNKTNQKSTNIWIWSYYNEY